MAWAAVFQPRLVKLEKLPAHRYFLPANNAGARDKVAGRSCAASAMRKNQPHTNSNWLALGEAPEMMILPSLSYLASFDSLFSSISRLGTRLVAELGEQLLGKQRSWCSKRPPHWLYIYTANTNSQNC